MPDKFTYHKIRELCQKAGVCVPSCFDIYLFITCERETGIHRGDWEWSSLHHGTHVWGQPHRKTCSLIPILSLYYGVLYHGGPTFELTVSGLLALNPLADPEMFL